MHESLKQILMQEDTVLFVGSGVSLWSGLPTWSKLIELLAVLVEHSGSNPERIRAEASGGDLLQAASYGFDKLTKQQIGDFIKKTCLYGSAKPHSIHKQIVTLGPSCFITTNYDNLIEEALRTWQTKRPTPSIVTNRHLTETAGIVHARANNFVFKPHGDAADSESIILTREQYRQLLPGGERQAALESVKMLLASRPVVYIGFGLRDPDFIHVKDILSNTYKGGVRDHYAIMADVSSDEKDYWRKNYGIHLTSYTTIEKEDKSRDHSNLLVLLNDLQTIVLPEKVNSSVSIDNGNSPPEVILALARHAGKVTRTQKRTPEFPIRVHLDDSQRNERKGHLNFEFNHWAVEKFLDSGPNRALLIGLPGAGKSYALQRAAARLAEVLNNQCLSETFDQEPIVIPFFVDLKLYQGDLHDLVNQMLPVGLSLDDLLRCFKVKIFLDSFNEMPRAYWESASYEADFSQFFSKLGDSSIIIGSRTNDGLKKFEFTTFYLDEIDDEFVGTELNRLRIDVSGRFEREMRALLQKPFYFHLVTAQAVRLPQEPHPRDFYQIFFKNLAEAFREKFDIYFDIERALSLTAYEAINLGEEAQLLTTILRRLKSQLQGYGISTLSPTDVANWLVSKSILIPYTGGRVAFFHQSATEYLAASELARLYQLTPQILKEKLALTRWDQALFLTLSLLPNNQSEPFLQAVIDTDFSLALNASKYLENGLEEVVTKLLSEIPNRTKNDHRFDHRFEFMITRVLAISEVHEPQLRKIMELRNSIGGAAASRLITLKGVAIKDEMLQLLLSEKNDYNFCCNGIASALQPFITVDDVQTIVDLADSLQFEITSKSDEDEAVGFISAAADLLFNLDIHFIERAFISEGDQGCILEVRARILCELLWNSESEGALELAGRLLLLGVEKAATSIYFISQHSKNKNNLYWTSFNYFHVEFLISKLKRENMDSWIVRSLVSLCKARPDLATRVNEFKEKAVGFEKAVLSYCADSNTLQPIFIALEQYVNMGMSDLEKESIYLLSQIDFNWLGKEVLLIQLLKLRDSQLAYTLIDGLYSDSKVNELDIGPIEWWLQWLVDDDSAGPRLFRDRLHNLLAHYTSIEIQDAFMCEFNKETSIYRKELCKIFFKRNDITTELFSEDAILFLITDLKESADCAVWGEHLLGAVATENFVTERLLPLLSNAQPKFLENLQSALKQAGSRHGRRYINS